MRLIDADALIDDIKNNLWDWETVDGITATTVLKQTISDIRNQPTIEERKTGKWVRHYSRPNVYADMCWHCSNCGYKTPDNWANKWKFCPDCGARMVREGEDNG